MKGDGADVKRKPSIYQDPYAPAEITRLIDSSGRSVIIAVNIHVVT